MTSLDDIMRAADSFKAYAAQQKDSGGYTKLLSLLFPRQMATTWTRSLCSHVVLCSRSIICAQIESLEECAKIFP